MDFLFQCNGHRKLSLLYCANKDALRKHVEINNNRSDIKDTDIVKFICYMVEQFVSVVKCSCQTAWNKLRITEDVVPSSKTSYQVP
jgi:hypothetical protein